MRGCYPFKIRSNSNQVLRLSVQKPYNYNREVQIKTSTLVSIIMSTAALQAIDSLFYLIFKLFFIYTS